jgi:hypothetical protein
MKEWTKPSIVEICMNAEIGAYQEDRDDPRDAPPLLDSDRARPATPASLARAGAHE